MRGFGRQVDLREKSAYDELIKMPKIILDYQKCISCGLCATLCPDLFQRDDKSATVRLKGTKKQKNKAEAQVDFLACAKEAADACPASAISLKD